MPDAYHAAQLRHPHLTVPNTKEKIMNETIYIVKGHVTCTDAHPGAQIGDVEWQFSDGPPGERSSSADYVDLEVGLREMSARLPGARFVFYRDHDDQTPADTFEED